MAENKFDNLEDESQKAPEVLKGMVVSEVDVIRDTMQIVGMFLGESFMAASILLQEAVLNENQPVTHK